MNDGLSTMKPHSFSKSHKMQCVVPQLYKLWYRINLTNPRFTSPTASMIQEGNMNVLQVSEGLFFVVSSTNLLIFVSQDSKFVQQG